MTDSDVQSQIAKLKAAKVKALMIFATPKFAIQSYVYAHKLGWKPKVFMNAVSSASNVMGLASVGSSKKQTEGTISIVFLKDPTDPRWAKDKGMKLYRSIMKKYKGTTPKDVYNVFGMSVAHTFVEALKKAGKNPTRASIMKAATHLNIKNDPFLLPGVRRSHVGDRPLPARPGAAPAVPQRPLGFLWRPLSSPLIPTGHFRRTHWHSQRVLRTASQAMPQAACSGFASE